MANSRAKGSKNERELCKFWKEWSGLEFTRVPASGGLRWKKKDDITGDLICVDPRKSRRFPFSIETKFYKDINFEHLLLGNKKQKIVEFWSQAKEDGTRADRIPILFMRYNGMPKQTWFTVVQVNIWNKILKRVKPEYPYFKVTTLDDEFVIFNSNELMQLDYTEFSIYIKKMKRNGIKN